MNLENLIEAFFIFYKYENKIKPLSCRNDELQVLIDPDIVSDEDTKELHELGFYRDLPCECFTSIKYDYEFTETKTK